MDLLSSVGRGRGLCRGPGHRKPRIDRTRSDSGMVTAELAVAVLSLVAVVMLLVAVILAGVESVRVQEVARVAARSSARGDSSEQVMQVAHRVDPAAHVTVSGSDGFVEVTVTRTLTFAGLSIPGVTVTGRSTAWREPR